MELGRPIRLEELFTLLDIIAPRDPPRAYAGPDDPRPEAVAEVEATRRAIAAAEEKGPIVLNVWCEQMWIKTALCVGARIVKRLRP